MARSCARHYAAVIGASDIALFFGRLHVLLVHLPIGLIFLLGMLELLALSTRFRAANANAGVILAIAVPVAIFSVVCGLLLSSGGGYEASLLQWHKWTGIGTASACILASLAYLFDLKRLYRICLFLAVAVLTVASHFGGSLTHGSDYLVRYAPARLRALLGDGSDSQATNSQHSNGSFFAQVIQPIFTQDCLECHGPNKSKAGLRLDSFAALLKGGDSGPAVAPGKSAQSTLLARLRLPLDDNDHMPPGGKPQPLPEDLALLQWWINAGASADKTMGDLRPPPNIARIVETRLASRAPVAKAVPPRPLNEVLPLAAKLSDSLGITVSSLGPQEPWLQCNASLVGNRFGDAELAQLVPLAMNLRWLDLAGTKITDAGLTPLSGMPNLTRLHLERTAITDAGLSHLSRIASLEYLDLYATQITDAGLEQLQRLPHLRHIYLWQTKVTPSAATAFTEAHTDRDQIKAWQTQIADLQAKISDMHVTVDLGTSLPAPAQASAGSPSLNSRCPVSGKAVDPAKTTLFEGSVVAFCCDDCKAKFQADPNAFVAKLGLKPKMPETKPK